MRPNPFKALLVSACVLFYGVPAAFGLYSLRALQSWLWTEIAVFCVLLSTLFLFAQMDKWRASGLALDKIDFLLGAAFSFTGSLLTRALLQLYCPAWVVLAVEIVCALVLLYAKWLVVNFAHSRAFLQPSANGRPRATRIGFLVSQLNAKGNLEPI